MAGLAVLAKELGFKVSGCDAKYYPPMSDQLEANKIECIQGFDLDNMKIQSRFMDNRKCCDSRNACNRKNNL